MTGAWEDPAVREAVQDTIGIGWYCSVCGRDLFEFNDREGRWFEDSDGRDGCPDEDGDLYPHAPVRWAE